jgi:hypothetical protein
MHQGRVTREFKFNRDSDGLISAILEEPDFTRMGR